MKLPVTIIYIILGTLNLYGQMPYSKSEDIERLTLINTVLVPVTPQLMMPEDNSESVKAMPKFEWEDVSADFYRIQIAAYNGQGTQVVIDAETSNNFYIPEEPLDYLTLHFWQVMAVSAEEESEWSDTWSFTTQLEPPSAPNLLVPANQEKNVELNTVIIWNSVNKADSYTIQVALGSNFNFPLIEATQKDTTHDLGSLDEGQLYSWRVKSWIGEVEGDWSIPFKFTTKVISSVKDLFDEKFKLFPSPAQDYLNISTEYENEFFIEIFSIDGRKAIEKRAYINNNFKLDISGLPRGLYYLRAGSGKIIINNKFTKI